jgi:hypothetical protein
MASEVREKTREAAPVSGASRVPPPGAPARVAIVDSVLTADDRGNTVLRGKIRNQTQSISPRVEIEATFDLLDGARKTFKIALEMVKKDEARDFEFKTDIPLSAVNRYYVNGQYVYFQTFNMPPPMR